MASPSRTDHTSPQPSGSPTPRPHTGSLLVPGAPPARRGWIVALSVLAGFALTVVWSAHFVDSTIGDNVANTLLGYDAKETAITGIGAGVLFAFVTGLAGTFTACNVAVFGAVAPMLGGGESRLARLRRTLTPIGWLAVGMLAVSATYGAVVGIVGTGMPQFSTTPTSTGLSPRLIQAMVVFGAIGLIMIYLGLAALRLAPDPFAQITRRFPNAPMVFIGVLIGAFLIGRPFPLFRQMFRDAAESGNPWYGAAAFSLQSIGNIALLAVLFLLLAYTVGGRLQRWMAAKPGRPAGLIAAAFLVAGAFLVLYWDVRLPARLDLFPWYPLAPWV